MGIGFHDIDFGTISLSIAIFINRESLRWCNEIKGSVTRTVRRGNIYIERDGFTQEIGKAIKRPATITGESDTG
jgi:hypothetical protein